VQQCDLLGDAIDFVVTVRVAVPARSHIPQLSKDVSAEAHAGPV
jgi:hypothetical protein